MTDSNLNIYSSNDFLEVMRNDPILGLRLSFAADMMAGRMFGADVIRCRNVDWRALTTHKLFKPLQKELINFWREALKGLKIVRAQRSGQGLMVADLE